MLAIHNILAITARSWNIEQTLCANEAHFAAACAA